MHSPNAGVPVVSNPSGTLYVALSVEHARKSAPDVTSGQPSWAATRNRETKPPIGTYTPDQIPPSYIHEGVATGGGAQTMDRPTEPQLCTFLVHAAMLLTRSRLTYKLHRVAHACITVDNYLRRQRDGKVLWYSRPPLDIITPGGPLYSEEYIQYRQSLNDDNHQPHEQNKLLQALHNTAVQNLRTVAFPQQH